MDSVFTTLDLILFLFFLALAMAVGLIAGRREDSSEDYYLAGRKIPWWGVAGSIFGSNVSANHLVGMMGIGFSVGFAQSHFELGAIAGLMLLCYGFLPVYRKLNLYTLSEYLERRYDQRSRLAYAIIMLVIMTGIHMGQGLYIGARSTCVLLGGRAVSLQQPAPVPQIPPGTDSGTPDGENADGENADGENADGENADTDGGTANEAAADGVDDPDAAGPQVQQRLVVNRGFYVLFVLTFAGISATYTIFGGLKAVVWTDVIQSILMLVAAVIVAVLTFHALGGWNGWATMMELDGQSESPKMRLYLPSNHPDLPWTGVFTGLMAMHFFYWGTNQFIVQRALGARSDSEARLGIIAAGFLKLLIPVVSIAAGIAAFYLFRRDRAGVDIAPDTAFTEVVKLVVPIGVGVVGLIAAGLIGAILSSIDSMMNSAATIFTIDIYKRYFRPAAGDREMIVVGRLFILAMVALAAMIALLVIDPNSNQNFFLTIADYQNYLTPGVLVVFALGMFWKRGTRTAAFVTILAGIGFSFVVQTGYDRWVGDRQQADFPRVYQAAVGQLEADQLTAEDWPETLREASPDERTAALDQMRREMPALRRWLGPKLNFFHRVVGVIGLCVLLYAAISMIERPRDGSSEMTWARLGGHDSGQLRLIGTAILVSIGCFAGLALLVRWTPLTAQLASFPAAIWAAAMFLIALARFPKWSESDPQRRVILRDDRLWAGVLCGLAVWMMFYFA